MIARRAYELKIRRAGSAPALLASLDRIDRVEVLDMRDGEVVFLWELPAAGARRLVRALREDLGRLDAGEFVAAWREAGEQGRAWEEE